MLSRGEKEEAPAKKNKKPAAKKASPSPPRSAPQRKMPQVQHDAMIAGGMFVIMGGALMLLSSFLPWLESNGGSLGALDLLESDTAFILILVASGLGAVLLGLSSLILIRIFMLHSPLHRLPLVQAFMAMAGALAVIAAILFMQREYYGDEALYGAGAFMDVIGAILVMCGATLTHLMSGHRPKATTGFQALAERSMRPTGRKEWKPPETSVRLPTCPTCGEELQPGWKACPKCGHALIDGDMEPRDSL